VTELKKKKIATKKKKKKSNKKQQKGSKSLCSFPSGKKTSDVETRERPRMKKNE
jgi:hypothetical protein